MKPDIKNNAMKSTFKLLTCTIWAGITGAASLGAQAGTTDHLDMGLELVEHLFIHQTAGQFTDGNMVPLNQYGGSWNNDLIVEVGDHNLNILPRNNSVCGNFVTKLLNHSFNWNWNNYEFFDPNAGQNVTTASPNSHRYMELINQQIGFKDQILQIQNVQPGDIMVKRDVGTTSGHVWIIKEVILAQPMPYYANQPASQNNLIGTTYYEVDVLDCSSDYHSNDSRKVFYNGQVYETHGAGVGTVGLLADANGTILGHTWSLPSADYFVSPATWVSQLNDKIELFDETELVVGRLDLAPSQANNIDDIQSGTGTDSTDTNSPNNMVDSNTTPDDQGTNTFVPPTFLAMGRTLLEQILACQSTGIFLDQDGVEINRNGGSWGSSSNPAMIRFADLDNGILPLNNNKGTTLVGLLLQTAYDHSWKDYPFYDTEDDRVRTTSSPGSSQYVDLIEQQAGFSAQVHTLTNAYPGDVLAVRYISNWSGHTMMINAIDWSAAVEYPATHPDANPDLAGTWYVPVQVLDSTSNPHSNDTREMNGVELEGIGTGTIGVLIDDNGAIVGHTWSLPSSDPITSTSSWISSLHNRLKWQQDRKMVIGRF
jgi:hypothetical protein